MYTEDAIISAAIAEDYIEHIRIARDQLEQGQHDVCLLILRCAQQLISDYLINMHDLGLKSDGMILH